MTRTRTFRKLLWVLWQGLLLSPRTYLLFTWFALRQRPVHRRAIRKLRAAIKRVELGADTGPDPLRALEPGLYEVEPEYLAAAKPSPGGPATVARRGPTIVHLLGTGENIYSPLIGLAALCRAEPRLRHCRHVIADTPNDAACFLGPNEFATRVRRALEPVLAQNRERIVLAGLSRGATAAFNLGPELAQAHGTRVGVLSASPPLARPAHPPRTVLNIGWLEPVTENFVRTVALLPWLAPLGNALLHHIYIEFSGFVLAELDMSSDASIEMFARSMKGRDPQACCLRAVREFALLVRVSDAELRQAASAAVRRVASSDRVRIALCWGQGDAWVDVAACRARVQTMIERDGVSAERLSLHVLDDHKHGLGREPHKDFSKLGALLWEVCEHAASASGDEVVLSDNEESTEHTA